jgi:hypothetical protein
MAIVKIENIMINVATSKLIIEGIIKWPVPLSEGIRLKTAKNTTTMKRINSTFLMSIKRIKVSNFK